VRAEEQARASSHLALFFRALSAFHRERWTGGGMSFLFTHRPQTFTKLDNMIV